MTRNFEESLHSRSRIVRNQEWDPALAKLDTLDLAELELSLLGLDAVDGEAALGVVDETEVLAGLLERDDVHETSGEGGVGADLAVDLDQTLHHDGLDLTTVESVLQTIRELVPVIRNTSDTEYASGVQIVPVADEDNQGQAVTELVRTGGGLGRIGAGHFVQQPVRGRAKALLVLLTVEGIAVSLASFLNIEEFFSRSLAEATIWKSNVKKASQCRRVRVTERMCRRNTYGPRPIVIDLVERR